ncbi:MAG: hypothetical protein COT21_02215 [Hadesarchaea archaeon CG08_land_8_20_14_0_20_51_8]|nr:MAG: hypothetical protein COT21_02215 [Hadesarchaea archaeon CG08_land_8_20_14_0_20_51_8]
MDLYIAGENVKGITGGTNATVDYSSVGADLQAAKAKLEAAGDVIDDTTENFVDIRTKLYDAGTLINTAGTKFDAEPEENFTEYANRERVAENLKLAGTAIQDAADQLLGGSLRQAGTQLQTAASRIYDAAMEWAIDTDSNAQAAANKLDNYVNDRLNMAGQKLINAAQYDNLAGINLKNVAAYLSSVGSLVSDADTTDLGTAGTNLTNAATEIGVAGDNLSASTDNILQAGDNLSRAATYLATAATELGAPLGDDGLTNATADENAAAENLKDREKVNLTAAGDALIAAASGLSTAASTMENTADAIGPATWTLASDATDKIRFAAIGENYIAPGDSQTFTFLWKTPDIDIENSCTLTVLIYNVGKDPSAVLESGSDTVTLTVDGKLPTLVINVTQVGVIPVNVVGNKLDNARATITITSSEPLQSIGTVYVENSGGTKENFLPPIENTTLTVVDEHTYKYEFITVGEWDENVVAVRVSSAKDLAGNENKAGMENTVTVDTRAPIFVPPENSGLSTLVGGMQRENVVQAGTGTVFRYVDNKTAQSITIRVEDNAAVDKAKRVISVTVDTAAATRGALIENLWGLDPLTLSEGLISVLTVTATDWTGNSVSDNVENIFIDTKQPTIEFNTITKAGAAVGWTSGILTNDNSLEIKLTIKDQGYPTSGLGIAYPENLIVMLSHKSLAAANPDNFFALYAETDNRIVLENKAAWDPSTGVFENLADNAGKGLLDRTYYIHVWASDNLFHGIEYGKVASRSFTIDTVKPKTDDIGFSVDYTATTPAVPHPQKITTLAIGGTVKELDGVIKVYVAGVLAYTSDALTSLDWTASVTLTAGTTQRVQVTYTDVAGNESDKKQYGYFLADGSAPTVTISSPVTGASTDKTSIQITGYVTKNDWEDFADFAGKVKIQVGGASPGDVTLVQDPTDSNKGNFTSSATLGEGTNVITITAKDAVGNVGSGSVSVERTVAPLTTYAIIIVVVALILAAIAIFVKK